MKRKIFWGSVVVALLILVSSQIVILNTVKSDPSSHTGDADVGRLWISELNVESAVESFDFIGIGHTNATDDWVLWEDGIGNITADWNVDIDNNHPEYYVRYYLIVFNVDVDDDDKEIGNATFEKTYSENTSYDEDGTLTVALEFTPEQIEEKSQTLVCYLQAWATLNGTQEAVNFTSFSNDRAVVAVDFESPLQVPQFSTYVNESNEVYPSMWSWIDGWEERFESEYEMLNTQTYFEIGKDQSTPEVQGNDIWYLGTVTFQVLNEKVVYKGFNVDEHQIEWEYADDGWMYGPTRINYTRDGPGDDFWFKYRYKLRYEGEEWCTKEAIKTVKKGDSPYGYLQNNIRRAVDVWEPHNIITIGGYLWCEGYNMWPRYINLGRKDYSIKIVEDGDNYAEEGEGYYYWEDACAYHNVSEYSVEVSSSSSGGITTVETNIYEVVGSTASDELIYTFAGDSGNVRVSFICES